LNGKRNESQIRVTISSIVSVFLMNHWLTQIIFIQIIISILICTPNSQRFDHYYDICAHEKYNKEDPAYKLLVSSFAESHGEK
jgi:hypothetical protein